MVKTQGELFVIVRDDRCTRYAQDVDGDRQRNRQSKQQRAGAETRALQITQQKAAHHQRRQRVQSATGFLDAEGDPGEVDDVAVPVDGHAQRDRKSTRLNSSHLGSSYAVFRLKKKKKRNS